jgi:phosphate transport system substrate-binding protein
MRSLSYFFILSLLLGCNTEEKESTTKGTLRLVIPESLAPVMIDEMHEFLNLYEANGAHITDTVVPAVKAAQMFVRDSTRIAFLPRPLTQAEKDQASTISTDMNEVLVAYDALVAAVHPKNKTLEMTTTELQKLLLGKITRWEEISKHSKGAITIYYHDSSDVTEYVSQRLLNHANITGHTIHTNSDIQTLHMVEQDVFAIGLVSLGWLDSAKTTVKILKLGRTKEDTDTSYAVPSEAVGQFFSPHPANLFRNFYPLKRPVYMYTRGRVNLAVGFGAYVATAEGQKIFLKHGLLPGTQRITLRSEQPS